MGGLLLLVPRPQCRPHCFKLLHPLFLSPCRLRRRRSKPCQWLRLHSLPLSRPGRRQCSLLRRGMRPLGPLTGTGLQPAMARPRYMHPARSTAARPLRLPPCPRWRRPTTFGRPLSASHSILRRNPRRMATWCPLHSSTASRTRTRNPHGVSAALPPRPLTAARITPITATPRPNSGRITCHP